MDGFIWKVVSSEEKKAGLNKVEFFKKKILSRWKKQAIRGY
ncbi:hypothetical protein MSIBF_A2370001 [groundwater metagenome]|uniref:Uncharacterized protein n=1 Tax=groundwater metagenome TaxID=717931 RepID=A0A098EBT2_9ZZZZ